MTAVTPFLFGLLPLPGEWFGGRGVTAVPTAELSTMKSHALTHIFRWPLFWLAFVLTVGNLSAVDAVVHNPNTLPIQVKLWWFDDAGDFDEGFEEVTVPPEPADDGLGDGPGAKRITWTPGTYSSTGYFYVAVKSEGMVVTGNSYVFDDGVGELDIFFGDGNYGDPVHLFEIPMAIHQATPDDMKTLWLVPDTTLTADLYREGVDKQVAAQQAAAPMSATQFAETKTEQVHDLIKDTYDNPQNIEGNSEFMLGQLEADDKATAAEAEFLGLMPTGIPTSNPHTPDVSGDAAFLAITMPAAFGGQTIDFNPFAAGRLGGVASWFRSATAWLVLMLLAYFIFQETKQFFMASAAANQAKGNPLVGGTGAQGTALFAAGVITAFFVTFVTALMSWTFGDITIPSLITNMSTNPLSGAPAHMLWFLDQFLPIATILSAFIARVSFPMYGQALYGVFITALRFVIP